jgi:DNA modification methylase
MTKFNSLCCYRCQSWPCSCSDGQTLLWGDCRVLLPQLGPVDLVLTDPPYGIGESRKKNQSRGCLAQSRDYGTSDWDDAPPPAWVLGMIGEKAPHRIIFGGNFFDLPPSSCWLVWDKDNGETDFADCELAWTNLPKAVRRIRWRWQGMLQENMANKEPRVHRCQKPLGVTKWAIQQAPEECETVLDPFAGSGTTLVAAKQLGRRCIGIEIEEKYVQIAANRLRQSVLQFNE